MPNYTLTAEQLRRLLEDQFELESLRCRGVDNWCGFDLDDPNYNSKTDGEYEEWTEKQVDEMLDKYKQVE